LRIWACTYQIPIPRWAYLDSRSQFVSARHVEDTGWTGNPDTDIYVFHFLHGDSDKYKEINISYNGELVDAYSNLMDIFYGPNAPESIFQRGDAMPHLESPSIREALFRSYRDPEEWKDFRPVCTGTVPFEELQ
jgi:hypothetical protein